MTKRAFGLLVSLALIEALLILFVDRRVAVCMHQLDLDHADIINLFRAYTDFAKSKWYLWPSGIGILLCAVAVRSQAFERHRIMIARAGHRLTFFFASIALSGIITDIIKPIVGRARPVELVRDNLYGFHPMSFMATWNSMPSGHSTSAAALAASLIVLFPRWRWLWVFVALAFIASRVMVNAHYISDTLAGSAIGLLTTLFLVRRMPEGMFPCMKGIFPIDKRPPAP